MRQCEICARLLKKVYTKAVLHLLSILDQSLLVIPLRSEKNLYRFGCYSGLPWKHGYHDNGKR